jgi:hypothetical protein
MGMLVFCNKYGDPTVGNDRWYLNPLNYAWNICKLRIPGEGFKRAETGIETGAIDVP